MDSIFRGVALYFLSANWRESVTYAGKQEAQVFVNLRACSDRASRIAARHLLLYGDSWRNAFEKARSSIAEKPILVDIWATWCKNCLAIEKTTLRDLEVEKELSRFNVIRLQAEDLSDLAKVPELSGLGIKGIPAFVVFE